MTVASGGVTSSTSGDGFSTSVTFALTAAAMYAETSPAEPAPITTRLRSNFAGFVQRA
ncbi:hypothetical protein D3C83_325250 [compost metagenome]